MISNLKEKGRKGKKERKEGKKGKKRNAPVHKTTYAPVNITATCIIF